MPCLESEWEDTAVTWQRVWIQREAANRAMSAIYHLRASGARGQRHRKWPWSKGAARAKHMLRSQEESHTGQVPGREQRRGRQEATELAGWKWPEASWDWAWTQPPFPCAQKGLVTGAQAHKGPLQGRPVPYVQGNFRFICFYLKPCFLNLIHLHSNFIIFAICVASCTNISLIFLFKSTHF